MRAKWLMAGLLAGGLVVACLLLFFANSSRTGDSALPVAITESTGPGTVDGSAAVLQTPVAHAGERVSQDAPPAKRFGEPLRAPPVPEHVPRRPAPQMGWARASYDVDGRTVAPGNHSGRMTLVHVSPGAKIDVALHWPEAIPGATIALEVLDGGRLEGDELSMLARVNEQGELRFSFTANWQPGRCQVVARHGRDETTLYFWVRGELAQNMPSGL